MTFDVKFLPSAQDDLSEIEADQAEWIVEKVRKILSENPFPRGNVIKQIRGSEPPFSRLRAGKWRIFFRVIEGIVWILAVAPKPKAGRVIKKLIG